MKYPTRPFTPRQTEVLGMLTKGMPNKAIAEATGSAETTVKVHVSTILRKLNVDNRTQAAMWARDNTD